MLLLRYFLLAAFAVLLLWWPVNYLLTFFLYKRRVLKTAKDVQSVDDYPLIGCALRFWGKDNEEIFDLMKEEYTKTERPFLGWLGTKCFVVIDHPDDIQVVINSRSCIEKSDVYRFFNRGVGLFSAPAHIWKPQRKRLSMSFNNQICWSFLPIFNEKANLFVRNVGHHVGKGEFDILNYSSAWALDIVCDSVLGTPMNIQDGENSNFMNALAGWLTAVTQRIANVFLHPDIIYKQTSLYQQECDSLAISEAVEEKIIQQKLKEFGDGSTSSTFQEDEDEETQFETPQIFIERLIKMRNKGLISDQAIRDQVHLIIFAGQETSSYTIAMAIFMLANHPEVEQRVMDELNAVLGDLPLDANLTMDHITQLTYMEQVLKEVLRMFPVAPFLMRHCTEDTKLPNFVIPANTEVIISSFTAHRRKDIWGGNADEFNPDNFDREANSKRNPFAFMAFSNGPRNCIGQRFAIISIKIILAKILRSYRFKTHVRVEDLKFRIEITSKPSNGIIVEVEKRNSM